MSEDIVLRLKDGKVIRKDQCVEFRIETDGVWVKESPLETGRPYERDEIANWSEVLEAGRQPD